MINLVCQDFNGNILQVFFGFFYIGNYCNYLSVASCQQLYESHPPFSLEREAEADLARGKGRGAGRGEGASSFLVRLVIYSAPVLVGVVIWRFLQSST